MLPNVPAVFLDEAVTRIVPMKFVRTAAAVTFAAIGLWVVSFGVGENLAGSAALSQ